VRRTYLAALLLVALAGASSLRLALGDWGPPSPFLFYPRGPGYVITSFVFDTLVWKEAHGIIPWLAKSWEIRNNTIIFHLRKAYWSDGVPLTAEDVVFTFNYVAKHGWQWKNFQKGLIEKVYAPNNSTVVFVLKRPYPFFLEEYAATVFIIPKHVWQGVKDPYAFNSPKAFVGSGPYVLKEYKPNQYYVFEANPKFWGPKPKFRELIILASGLFNPQKSVTALLQGEVDSVTLMGKAYRLVVMAKRAMPNLKVQKGPMYWVLFLGFNLDKYPFDVLAFRRAIAYSLNLKELVLKAVGSLEAALPGTPGYVPPYSPFYNPNVPKYQYNLTKAEELLDILGIKDVNGDGCRELLGKEWRPVLVTTKSFIQEALIIKGMLKRVGICVKVKVVPSAKQLDALVSRGEFDMEINGHGADGNDPTAFSWWFKYFGTPWYNGVYQEVVKKILEARTKEEAYKYARAAQYVIAMFLPRIALYYPYEFVLTRSGVNVKWFFTYGGIDGGIPLPYNKLALLR